MENPSFTLTSGPTMMSDRVRAALGAQVIYDSDPLFLKRFVALGPSSRTCSRQRTTSR